MNLTDAQLDAACRGAQASSEAHFDSLDFDISEVEQNAYFVRALLKRVELFKSPEPTALHVGDDHLSGEVYWRYTEPAPRGVKLNLLTKGKIAVVGDWHDGHGYIAWSPLIRRDKQLEEELGL